MLILKFGGSSVGSADAISRVKEILNKKPGVKGVVVSAMKGITNMLESAGNKAAHGDESYLGIFKQIEDQHLSAIKALIKAPNRVEILATTKKLLNNLEDVLHGIFLIKEFSPRSQDLVLSYGERLSATIINTYLNQEGLNTNYLDARDLIKTDSAFGNARVDFRVTNKNIRNLLQKIKTIPIITGFVSSNKEGVTTTLGRGGSDYTAAIFASALDVSEIEIWTDVDGVLTADPKEVKNAFPLEELSYNEAMELSYFGAKVIHPPTLQPAINKKIPLRIRNTFNPEFHGTLIRNSIKETSSNQKIKGISSVKDISLVSIIGSGMVGVPGVSSRLFGTLSRVGINVILISQASSEHSICFAIDPKNSREAELAIRDEFELELERKKIEDVAIENDLSIIAVVGENMKHTPGISSKLFNALGHNGVNVVAIAQGSSEINISVVIEKENIKKSLNLLHDAFFLSEYKNINAFLVGTGLIGSTLIDQVKSQSQYLREKLGLAINIAGIANSRNMHFDPGGINLSTWRNKIDKPGKGVQLDQFTSKMIAMNLPNSVFVDCTSSKDVTSFYQQILGASISIVTPNKLANSGTHKNYELLKSLAFQKNVKYLFETNVGAGLPVIRTLNDLTFSGDQILSIEGVLSGTLSYIFNTYDGSTPFSQIVKTAMEKGFTEPDPRDDLSGEDVCRKILILGREAGFILEPSNVKAERFLPESCFKAKSISAFFDELEKVDGMMLDLIEKTKKKNQVLRYVASLEKGKTKVKLQSVGEDHPFYSLSGSDNIISFTTQRYKERPLVVKGPGAGADVTAAGVFSEIISIGNYIFKN